MIYFISDLHLGHEKICMMAERPFANADEMCEKLINNWNARVTNGDTVYILGDLVFENRAPSDILLRLNGNKILIVGNHDVKWLKNGENAKHFELVTPYLETELCGKPVTLCHYPMYEWRASRKKGSKKLGYHIHGHTHARTDAFFRPIFLMPHALNASVDVNGYMPVTFDELVKNNETFKLAALTDEVDKALFLAEKYHLYQADRRGVPYVEHPKAVAAMVEGKAAKCVALMHDLLEDTDIDIKILQDNFPPEVVRAVEVDTRRQGEDYFDYIERVSHDPLATRVKLADLTHNMDLSRLRIVTDADLARNEKYKKAYGILTRALRG